MRLFFYMVFVLFASTIVTIAQTFPYETQASLEAAAEEAAAEAKQIESQPTPPTQFEIEEGLKDAKQHREKSEQRAKSYATRLGQVQSIKQALAAGGGNPKEVTEQVSAYRKEIDDQISANSFDQEKLKSASANIKIISALPDPDILDSLLRGYVAQGDKDIMSLIRNLKTPIPKRTQVLP